MKTSEIRLGAHVLAPDDAALFDETGARVDLRFQAMQVLLALAAQPNAVVARADIIEAIWENREGAEEGLVQCIADIRRALNDSDKSIVETIPRKGYRLVATPVEAPDAPRGRVWTPLAALLGLVVLLALGAGWYWLRPVATERPVIAVLPFADQGEDGAGPVLGDVLAEATIATLARYSQFDVIAGQSSFRFRERDTDLREIGTLLGASYLVQGSQNVTGRAVEIGIQLVDAESGTLRMVDAFDVSLDEALAVSDDIAHRIANTVGGAVMDATARADRRPGEIDALILDNRGRQLFQSGPTREKWLTALGYQDQAIDKFPDVEWGYINKALMLRTGVRFGWETDGALPVLAEAEAAALRAIDLNPSNYMSHFALGRVLMQKGDVAGSIAALERARQLNPSSALVLNALGQSYIYADDKPKLSETIDRVARIDPLPAVLTLWVRAWGYWQLEQCEAAQTTIAGMPNVPLEMSKLRAAVAVCLGEIEAAKEIMATYLAARPNWTQAQEIATNAGNWVSDGPRDRWLAALGDAGLPG